VPSAVRDSQPAAPKSGEDKPAFVENIPSAVAEPAPSAVGDSQLAAPKSEEGDAAVLQNLPSAVAQPVQAAIRNPQLAAPQPLVAPERSVGGGEGGSAILQTVPPVIAEPVNAQPPSTAPANDQAVERRESADAVAPFLPAIVPSTDQAPDKPSSPGALDPAAAPAKIAGLNLPSPISIPTPANASPAVALAVAGDLAPLLTPLPPSSATVIDRRDKGQAPSLAPPLPPSGTPVATNGQRMKSALQRNEIAGSAAQKLPPDRQTVAAAAGANEAIPAPVRRIPADFSDPKQTAAPWMMIDTAAKGAAASTLTANAAGGGAPSFGRIEQVERMISREVVLVRQSGAESLSVSLKVDARTSLFLQLTDHHGQIEASVRCESDDAGALGAQWGQLQESLARHNVQLLPLEDKSFTAGTSSDPPADSPRNFQDGPSAQPPPPRPPSPQKEKPSDDAMNAAVGLSKPKNQTRRQHGWEKWA
jgi:hypothetical protein